ncbi:MAG: SirA family protein [Deltaproteobacteria bacterium RBG_13_58_19]|nr:MAG: SirA family protein [Deltaproteobacteria bacterium RBG_13_58_19]
MKLKKLDCRGFACPQPVLRTKEVLDQGLVEQITILLDNAAAQENVSRFLKGKGYQVYVRQDGETWSVTGVSSAAAPGQPLEPEGRKAEVAAERQILVLLATDRLGRGDDLLGEKLLANFLSTLKEMGPELWCLVLVNAGVKLAVAGSEVLPQLEELAQGGVQLLVCGTCLNHFQLLEKKQVGETTNMLDIISHLQLADKVISLT